MFQTIPKRARMQTSEKAGLNRLRHKSFLCMFSYCIVFYYLALEYTLNDFNFLNSATTWLGKVDNCLSAYCYGTSECVQVSKPCS